MLSALFAEAKEEEKEQTLQEEITEYIYHHVQDSHDFSFFSTKDKDCLLYTSPSPRDRG